MRKPGPDGRSPAMTTSSSKLLARGQVNATDSLTDELIQSTDMPAAVMIRWPTTPPVADPRSFPSPRVRPCACWPLRLRSWPQSERPGCDLLFRLIRTILRARSAQAQLGKAAPTMAFRSKLTGDPEAHGDDPVTVRPSPLHASCRRWLPERRPGWPGRNARKATLTFLACRSGRNPRQIAGGG